MLDIIIITTTLQFLTHKIFTTLYGMYDRYHWPYGETKPWRGEVLPYGHNPGGRAESKPQDPIPAPGPSLCPSLGTFSSIYIHKWKIPGGSRTVMVTENSSVLFQNIARKAQVWY